MDEENIVIKGLVLLMLCRVDYFRSVVKFEAFAYVHLAHWELL